MTGEHYDQMLRDANPHRPAAVDLDGADQMLLAQIVAEPVHRRRPFALAAVGAAAAVAVVVAVVALPATSNNRPEPPAVPASPSASASPAPVPDVVSKAAKESPRLLAGPGWTVVHVMPIGTARGEMAYEKGERSVMLTWHPAADYSGYRKDRHQGREEVTVAGLTGYQVAYGETDFDVVTEPHDGVFAELRTDDGWTREEFRTFLAGVRRVDVPTWIAAVIPPTSVPVIEALEGVPLTPSWKGGGLDATQSDTAVVRRVVCAWLTEWQRATFEDDGAAAQKAVGALLSSPDWPVVRRMEPSSALPRTIKVVAGRIAGGQADEREVDGYRRTFCGQN
ncbi:hypothetical protein ACQP2X_17810 [Actinoplanes sp. CA-131856]